MSVDAVRVNARLSPEGTKGEINSYAALLKALHARPPEGIEKLNAAVRNPEVFKKLITAYAELEEVVQSLPPEESELKSQLYFVCGQLFEQGGNHSDAFSCYAKASTLGYARAKTSLGMCYLTGRAGVEDPVRAASWLLTAAGEGQSRAQFNIAKLYSEGRGVAKDLDSAKFWCQKLVTEASPKMHQRLIDEAKQLLAELEKQEGVCVDYFAQGYRLEKEKNYPEALIAYQAAARHGHPSAFDKVGIFYLQGREGIKQNHPLAYQNFLGGANIGSGQCMYNAAVMLETGDGITPDLEKALELYTKAKVAGIKIAAERIAIIEQKLKKGLEREDVPQIKPAEYSALDDSGESPAGLKLGPGEMFRLIAPQKKDINLIQERLPDGYSIRDIKRIYSPLSKSAYLLKLAQLMQRAINPYLKPKWDKETNSELRQKFLKDFHQIAEPFSDPCFQGVPQIDGFHATSEAAIPHILSGGFVALRTTDEGWWGSGFYFSQMKYVFDTYAKPGKDGRKGPLLYCKLAIDNPYPVVKGDNDLSGKPLKAGFGSHIVPVKGAGGAYYPCGEGQTPDYWEWVVAEDSQIDKQLLVWIGKNELPSKIDFAQPESRQLEKSKSNAKLKKSSSTRKK